jgi:hypothetical protein
MFDEERRYLALLTRPSTPVVDADQNDASFALVHQLRRVTQHGVGEGHPVGNDGFEVVQSASPSNNFTIKGGDGTDEGAGRLFAHGFPCVLNDDVEYTGAFDARMRRVMPQVTSVSTLVLTDSTANWIVGEHTGKTLTPDVENPGTTFTIASNTATTITVTAGDLTTATSAQKHYRIELSTPSPVNRTDEVYLDLFLDEADDVEDTNFVHTDLTPNQSAAFRLVLRQFVRVREGGAMPAGHVDLDGRQHFTVLLATLARVNGAAMILTAQITDERTVLTGGGGSITVEEVDALPSVTGVTTIKFPDGTVTDEGGGVVRVDTSASNTGTVSRRAELTRDISGVAAPSSETMGTDIDALGHSTGVDSGQRFEVEVPDDYDSGPIEVSVVYEMSTAEATPNNVIRISTQAEIVDVTNNLIDSASYPETESNLTTLQTTDVERTAALLTIAEGDFGAGDLIQVKIKRIGTSGSDLHPGRWDIGSYYWAYTAHISTRATTISPAFTSDTDETATTDGTIGTDIDTVDFPSGADAETAITFHVPDEWDQITDAYVRLSFAMSSAAVGTVRVATEGEIANVEDNSFDTLSIINFDLVPPVDTDPHRSVVVRSIPASDLHRGDTIYLKVARRTSVGGNHAGTFKVPTFTITFGIAPVSGFQAVLLEENYMGLPLFRNVSAGVTTQTDAADETGDFEEYHTASATLPVSTAEAVFMGRLGGPQSKIATLKIPLKGSGASPQARVEVFVEGSVGNQYTGPFSAFAVLPASRLLLTITEVDLLAQPSSEKRYVVVVEFALDASETGSCGTPFFRHE